MWRELSKFGRKLVEGGFVSSHFGNISVRVGDRMLITRSGSMLDEIKETDIVEVDISKKGSFDLIASSESVVHRMIYGRTSALAVIHAHCPHSVIMSLLSSTGETIEPVDSEGQYFLHEIPIVKGGIGTSELAENVSTALKDHKSVIVKGHGTFAVGKILEEAFIATAMAEHSCRVKYFMMMAEQLTEG